MSEVEEGRREQRRTTEGIVSGGNCIRRELYPKPTAIGELCRLQKIQTDLSVDGNIGTEALDILNPYDNFQLREKFKIFLNTISKIIYSILNLFS